MTRTTGRHPDWWMESPGEDLAADLIWSALRSGECRICGSGRWTFCEHMERRLTPLNHPRYSHDLRYPKQADASRRAAKAEEYAAFVKEVADVVSSIRKG